MINFKFFSGGSFGFGAPATSTSFGFGQPQPQATGGLFGSTAGAAKPTFGVGGFGPPAGGTGTTFGAPAFGGSTFGATNPTANTGGSLFGANNNAAPKPLFGGGTSFGTSNTFGTQSFGGGAGAFGGASNFNLGGNTGNTFGVANQLNPTAAAAQGQPQVQPASIQSQLAALTSNPYGDNPLFKNLLPDNNRREEIMKPTNPAAQKAALNSSQYKVSPHHGLKVGLILLTLISLMP